MRLKTSFLFLLLLILFSCKKSTDPLGQQFKDVVPFGTWVFAGTENNIIVYYMAKEFEEDNSGIAFKSDNIYIERSSGWCATPPLSFSNFEGKWEVMDDNKIKITCSNWMDEEYGRFLEIVNRSKSEIRVIFHTIPE